jgi:HEPN domain-containing protein
MLKMVDLKALAEMRLAEARLLVAQGYFSGGYYLAGDAVELGLKAILARKFVADEIPDRDLVIKIYTHDLKSLVTQAGLDPDLKDRMAVDDRFSANWEIVRSWNERARYVINTDENARALLEAVSHQTSGVFPWIQAHW